MSFETTDYNLFARMIKRAVTDQLLFEAGVKIDGTYFINYSGQ